MCVCACASAILLQCVSGHWNGPPNHIIKIIGPIFTQLTISLWTLNQLYVVLWVRSGILSEIFRRKMACRKRGREREREIFSMAHSFLVFGLFIGLFYHSKILPVYVTWNTIYGQFTKRSDQNHNNFFIIIRNIIRNRWYWHLLAFASHIAANSFQIFFFYFWKIAMEFKSIGNDTFLEFEIWWSGPLKIGTTNLIGWDGRYQSQMNLSDGITILIQCISNLVHTKNGHFLNFPLNVLPTHFIWNALPFISKSKAWFCRRQFTSCLLNVDLETGRSSGTEAFQHELQQQPTI